MVRTLLLILVAESLVACVPPKNDSLGKIDSHGDNYSSESNGPNLGVGSHSYTPSRGGSAEPANQATSFSSGISSFFNKTKGAMQGLNWQGLKNRISSLGGSAKRCARGVKDSLATLFGVPKVDGDNVDACEVTDTYLNKNFSKKGQVQWKNVPLNNISQQGLQPGDVVVCNKEVPGADFDNTVPCIAGNWGRNSGHIEIVDSSGGLSSDFKQGGSLCLSSNKYKFPRVFRPEGAGMMAKLHLFMLISKAYAAAPSVRAQAPAVPGTKAKSSDDKKVLAQTATHAVLEVEGAEVPGQDSSSFMYYVYEKQNNRLVNVASSELSSYAAVDKLTNKTAVKELSKLLVEQEIKEYGSEELKQKILNRVFFSSAEKDAYIDAGFKLPDSYRIN